MCIKFWGIDYWLFTKWKKGGATLKNNDGHSEILTFKLVGIVQTLFLYYFVY